jgi:SulP family sulfate permease
LGALVRFVPVAIVIGFTNGIAVLIALSRLRGLFDGCARRAAGFLRPARRGAPCSGINPVALAIGLYNSWAMIWPRLFARPCSRPVCSRAAPCARSLVCRGRWWRWSR